MFYYLMSDTNMNRYTRTLLDHWPVITVLAAILSALIVTYFEVRVSSIAKEEISSVVPTSTAFLTLQRDIATLKNDSGDAEQAIGEVKTQLTRVEGKLDDLLLIMSNR